MIIEKAKACDIDKVAELYYNVTTALERGINYPAWRSDLYPVRETAQEAFDAGNLYVARDGDEIVGTMILKEENEEGFEDIKWQMKVDDSEVYTLCTLAVDNKRERQGIGKALIMFALDIAQRNGKKVIRLDVTAIHKNAIRLYENHGFNYIAEFDLGEDYEKEYGQRLFKIYERVV